MTVMGSCKCGRLGALKDAWPAWYEGIFHSPEACPAQIPPQPPQPEHSACSVCCAYWRPGDLGLGSVEARQMRCIARVELADVPQAREIDKAMMRLQLCAEYADDYDALRTIRSALRDLRHRLLCAEKGVARLKNRLAAAKEST